MTQPTAAPSAPGPPATLEQRYRDGDGSAFAELWRQHEPALRGLALRYAGHDRDLAEEALAEVTARLLEERVRGHYDPARGWLAWVRAILRNHICDVLRARFRHRQVPIEADLAQHEHADLDLARDLADCLARLPEDQRRLLSRKYVDGIRQAKIAVELKRSDAWVSRALEAAREALRECLQTKGYTVRS
jgi:RNA polymerase sigma-70 factor (ECF subfamily)